MPAVRRKRVGVRVVAVLLAILFAQMPPPPTSMAQTGGPSQPEFSSFESVSTEQMVDEFTGDFTYNLPVLRIPGPQGGGYSLSLSYHSGTSPDAEASWVGYGWTLNPGAIVRNSRGFPDDWDGQTVKYHQKTPDNWTLMPGPKVGFRSGDAIPYGNHTCASCGWTVAEV
ncbi:MAG TPA: hypothetical protein VJP78_01965 [Thermoleophilia bacterium]|nr:hypothetical protein [Thermoleophilia bacterium]